MRYVSLFSGIEAASVAAPEGWEAVAFAEIDKFASAVLAARFPNVPNLGDVCAVDWEEFVDEYGAIDLVCGGSPCQSFSIAGGRESLDGESRLMFEYIRAVQELRPRWFVWENVPGVLNTKDDAFGCFLDQMDESGYSTAWRVLDAQFFGVAQRRRRVWAVGASRDAFGDLAAGRAAAVLFERDSLRGNTETSKQARARLAASAGDGAERSYTLKLRHTGSDTRGGGVGALVQTDVSATLATGQDQTVFTLSDKAYAIQGDGSTSLNARGGGTATPASPSTASTATRLHTSDWRVFDGDIAPIVMATAAANAEIAEDCSPTLLGETCERPIVCMASDAPNAAIDDDLAGTLHVGGGLPLIASARCARTTARASTTST